MSKWVIFLWHTHFQTIRYGLNDTKLITSLKKVKPSFLIDRYIKQTKGLAIAEKGKGHIIYRRSQYTVHTTRIKPFRTYVCTERICKRFWCPNWIWQNFCHKKSTHLDHSYLKYALVDLMFYWPRINWNGFLSWPMHRCIGTQFYGNFWRLLIFLLSASISKLCSCTITSSKAKPTQLDKSSNHNNLIWNITFERINLFLW